jgi:hypothetical protein
VDRQSAIDEVNARSQSFVSLSRRIAKELTKLLPGNKLRKDDRKLLIVTDRLNATRKELAASLPRFESVCGGF